MALFDELMDALLADPDVSAGEMFGHPGARLGKKFFAIEYHGDVVLKLGAERVSELVADGTATPFEPMPGRAMTGWAALPPAQDGDALGS